MELLRIFIRAEVYCSTHRTKSLITKDDARRSMFVRAFSIGIDAGNNAGMSYLDVRMRCYLQNNLRCFHLLAIPMRERHTGEYQFYLVVALLDVIALNGHTNWLVYPLMEHLQCQEAFKELASVLPGNVIQLHFVFGAEHTKWIWLWRKLSINFVMIDSSTLYQELHVICVDIKIWLQTWKAHAQPMHQQDGFQWENFSNG